MCFTESCAEQAISEVKELALFLHRGYMYGKFPYEIHIIDVYYKTKHEYRHLPYHEQFILQAVALLHDTIEDTGITDTDLMLKLNKMQIPSELVAYIVRSVNAISKVKGENYVKYLGKVKSDPYACLVKYLDAESNLHQTYKDVDDPKFSVRKHKYEYFMQDLAPSCVSYILQITGGYDGRHN